MPPTPERITTALDMRELYGPEVDRALGGEEPMVDEWESGARVPAFEQVQRLSVLTGFPVKFFYQPAPQPLTGGWICGSDGCHPLGATSAAADLAELQDRTYLSKTDIVNRAISLYEFVEAQIAAGRVLLVRDTDSGDMQMVKLL